jgi:hypothetical protein
MPLSLPSLQEMPSVHAALSWLLDELSAENRQIPPGARDKGLIISDQGPHWKADGEIITRLAEAAISKLPSDPNRLGELLHGIGEIAARCHAPILPDLFVNELRLRQPELLAEAFDAAVRCDGQTPRQTDISNVALGQWIARSTLAWSTFDQAVAHIGHPTHVFGGFGLKFVARVLICTDPSVIDTWISGHPDHPAISIIGSAALTMVFPFDHGAAVAPLLKSTTPAIKCLGAAAIVCPLGIQPELSLHDCHKTLIDAGFTPADAIWLSGMRIKNAIHARYRIEHGREQNTARLRYIEKNPDKAIGGIRNAQFEIDNSRRQLERADSAYAELLPKLEDMLSDMAADWPNNGLSDEQMRYLEFIFVDTAEIRHCLAMKLSHQKNRNWLLKRNIRQLADFVGLTGHPEDVSEEYFLPDEKRFPPLAAWAAQSLVALYNDDNRGVGRRTSDLVGGVAKAAEWLIEQPFISGRRPDAWQAVTTRAACACRFAFMVVSSVAEERRETVTQLNSLALDFTFKLMSARNLPDRSGPQFHQLMTQAVGHMQMLPDPDMLREKWALASALPYSVRALAIWSSPSLVEKHQRLARDLFRGTCTLPMSRGGYNLGMSHMLTLLDLAIASAAGAQKSDLISDIKRLWVESYADWMPIAPQYESIAEKLVLAIERDGPERTEIVNDAVFASSLCRRLIDPEMA